MGIGYGEGAEERKGKRKMMQAYFNFKKLKTFFLFDFFDTVSL